MNTRTMLSFGLSALVFGGTMVGCSATHTMLATAGTSEGKTAAKAAEYAQKADRMMTRGKYEKAVGYAEQAVAYAPRDAVNRALLGQAYLKAGRFVSATQALNDTLVLDPGNGHAALSLALAQTATGDWDGARHTLETNRDVIAPGDRGLALALAGDPNGAISILSQAARGATASPTARQNLALALALAGRWREAKAVASIDVAPGELNDRMMEWAAFAKPKSASDQVAALLGVVPVADSGQPVRLALKDSDTQLAAVTPVDPAQASNPAPAPAPAPDADSDAMLAKAMETPAVAPMAHLPAEKGPAISFAPRREIVQQLPASYHATAPAVAQAASVGAKPESVASARTAQARELAEGNYYVQLGAYRNAAVAHDAWGRIKARHQSVAALTPSGMNATVHGRDFYRLSVGGFTRVDAVRLCGKVKSAGGQCFVRADAGDRLAAWLGNKDMQLASR
ncbi:tetratricopeptide repeat protein [Stakelama sp. CBK3Z-3]|uniref:Tetratricopeptide repeat protein n=1 Tax=Stakelama flava TaxID=2860338 RepID=A0ABS6XHG5_9SPHN|nr:tetratricopeptide repeat protein [Stakelama flava]MBW4329586.1 tetratricopeptide repeat protein [Stakelama flava]